MLIRCCKIAVLLGALSFTAGCASFGKTPSNSVARASTPQCAAREVYTCERIQTRQRCECLPKSLAQMRTLRMGFGR